MGKHNVLILSASPSPDSLSLACAVEFSRMISPSKARIIKIYGHKISSCKGCRSCGKGRCVMRDDFFKIRCAVKKAHMVITASPIYFRGVPSHFKAFIDRHQRFWHRPKGTKKTRGFIILAAGSDSPKFFSGAEQEIRAMYAVNNIKTEGVLRLSGTDLPGSREKAIKRASLAADKFLKGSL